MPGEWIIDGSCILVLVMGAVYLILIHTVSKRETRSRELTEAEMLAKLARMGPHTEFDLFRLAAREWHLGETRIEGDFRDYLLEGRIPYYVNSHMRKLAREDGNPYRPPFVLGGGSLPWLR